MIAKVVFLFTAALALISATNIFAGRAQAAAAADLQFPPIAQQAYVKSFNPESADAFGWSVAVSGNTVVIGAPEEDSSARGVNGNASDNSAPTSGAAYVFVRSGTNWTQQAYLKASNADAADRFGYAVAISGDTIVVGAYGESSSATGVNGNETDNSASASGAAYVFVRDGTNWTQQAYLKASNTGRDDRFGYRVAVSGDTAAVSSYQEDSNAVGVNGAQTNDVATDSGAVYVFVRSGTNWTQEAYLKASNTQFGDIFGRSVAVSGDTIVVGAPREDSRATGVNGDQADNGLSDSGAAYVFVRSGTNWAQQAYLKASNTGASDDFGFRVAVVDNTLLVGAWTEDSSATGVNGNQNDNSAPGSGAVYVFVRSDTNWTQQAYLKASNTGIDDRFGVSLSLSTDKAVVGAYTESSSATGVNGDQTNNAAQFAGAAYVYLRAGTNWIQHAYLKASNTGFDDWFGFGVGISGETIVIGGPRDDSAATGINGNEADNLAPGSGAAYVFTFLTQINILPDGSSGYFIRYNGSPGDTYRLQRAVVLAGPWETIDTQTAPASGVVEYHDTNPVPGQAFYRTVRP
jgi:hypothetical protein